MTKHLHYNLAELLKISKEGKLPNEVMEIDNPGYSNNICPSKLSPGTIKRIMREILKGLNYLHHNGIMHRNLKPENVILSETTKEIKITDYALSKEVLIPHVP